jgi:PTH2 family peptidyl-tRNA hydrolase
VSENTHKQVIVMRKDLNMRKGKMVAQGAHASLKAVLDVGKWMKIGDVPYEIRVPMTEHIAPWLTGLFKKICVSVDTEEEMIKIFNAAQLANIPCALITDSGLTEFNGVPTNTCIAVGPAHEDVVNSLTGHLKLL